MSKLKRTPAGDALTDLILDLFRLYSLLLTVGDRLVAPLGLTSARWQILGAMVAAERPQPVAWLARDMGANRQNVQRIINDLHKGRDTGKVWAGVIDISAILMVLVSLSGLVLIFFLHKKLRAGLIALAIGTVLCYVVNQIWVP